MKNVILLLSLLIPLCVRAGEPIPCGPNWRNGQTWSVDYKTYNPSDSGGQDQMDFEKWIYKVVIGAKGKGWVLLARKKIAYTSSERFEVRFSSALSVERVRHFDSQGQPSDVANDASGGAFQSHNISLPLLDWPLLSRAERRRNGCVLTMDKTGYNAYKETFVWAEGEPWWSSGERRWGSRTVTGLLERKGQSRAR